METISVRPPMVTLASSTVQPAAASPSQTPSHCSPQTWLREESDEVPAVRTESALADPADEREAQCGGGEVLVVRCGPRWLWRELHDGVGVDIAREGELASSSAPAWLEDGGVYARGLRLRAGVVGAERGVEREGWRVRGWGSGARLGQREYSAQRSGCAHAYGVCALRREQLSCFVWWLVVCVCGWWWWWYLRVWYVES